MTLDLRVKHSVPSRVEGPVSLEQYRPLSIICLARITHELTILIHSRDLRVFMTLLLGFVVIVTDFVQ